MSEMFEFKNYQWRKMANNGEKWRKMAMANLPFSFVKFAISPLAPPIKLTDRLFGTFTRYTVNIRDNYVSSLNRDISVFIDQFTDYLTSEYVTEVLTISLFTEHLSDLIV